MQRAEMAKARPMELSPSWTFALALALLRAGSERSSLEAMDKFLDQNKAILLLPLPFSNEEKSLIPAPSKDRNEVNLRGVVYSEITLDDNSAATKISELLAVDRNEILRIIVQTKLRLPLDSVKKSSPQYILSRLPDDSAIEAEKFRIQTYISAILTERRTVLRLLAECFNSRFKENSSRVIHSIGNAPVMDMEYLKAAIQALNHFIDGNRHINDETLRDLISGEALLHVTQLLKFVYEIVLSLGTSLKTIVEDWFTVMRKSMFCLSLGPKIRDRESFVILQSLCIIISLQLLGLDNDFTEGNAGSYINDPKAFQVVDDAVSNHCSNHIVQYAWLLLSHKKTILLEEFQEVNSSFLQIIPLAQTQAAVGSLRSKLQSVSIFEEIQDLHKALAFDEIFSITLSNLILLALPVISVTDDASRVIREVMSAAPAFCVERFFVNPEAARVVTLARAKFPYAISPFLNFAAINGLFAFEELKNLKSFMYSFNSQDAITNYEIDSDNTDLIKLTNAVDINPPYEGKNKLSLYMEAGTKAKVFDIGDNNQSLVMFLHDYNGWAFLGRVIENISKSFEVSSDEKITILTDVFSLIGRVCEQVGPNETSSLLDYMSSFSDESDIVDVIFRILEQAMHDRFVDLSERILSVLLALVLVIPQRIWAYLNTSSLLAYGGKEGLITILFNSVESKRGYYNFSITLVKFVSALAENCLSISTDYPEASKSEILAAFTRHLNYVLENCVNCKFHDGLQKLELGVLILNVFKQMLETIYCIGPKQKPIEKPTRVFSAAADCILVAFLDSESNVTSCAELIFQLIDFLSSTVANFEARDPTSFLLELWADSAFSFSKLLLAIRRSKGVQGIGLFERQMFNKLPKLVSIYLRIGTYRKSVLKLMTTLMSGFYKDGDTPSMLSHLGPTGSKALLRSLTCDLSNSFDDFAIKIAIYDFLCSMMEANQQGLSVLLISGQDVFGDFSSDKHNENTADQILLLSILKNNVMEVEYYPSSVSVHLLDAIALAFNSWTTATENESDVAFISRLVSMIREFEKPRLSDPDFDFIDASYRCKVMSKIAEILSLVLFTTKNQKSAKLLTETLTQKSFIEKLPMLFEVTDYDYEKYAQTHTRFESLFPKYKLSQFTTAMQQRNRFGPSAVYDLQILDFLFGMHPQWGSMRQDIVQCSANLQFFNTQVSLHKSFGALITTFCRRAQDSVVVEYFEFIPRLLTTRNPVDEYTEQFDAQQHYERIELAFYLFYAINNNTNAQIKPQTAIPILSACVDVLKSSTKKVTFESREGESQKSILRISYLALSNLKDSFDLISTNFRIFEEFFEYVIAQGTTNIVIELQNDVYLSRTKKKKSNINGKLDYLRLMLSVLKLYMAFDMIPSSRAKLIDTLAKHGTIDALRSLYSFAHLILVNDDPVFAQLSLMFTQELLLADLFLQHHLDLKLFIVIRESVISQPLRAGGINIENAPQLHQNWTNGILPILVMCLAKGQNVNEVLLTLKVFAKQIEYCVDLWSRDSASLKVSSACVIETSQLIYIYQFLSGMNRAEQLGTPAPSDVDMPFVPGLDTQQRRNDFVNFVSNLLKHPKFLMSRIVPSSAEEKALQKTNDKGYIAFVDNLINEIVTLKELIAE